MAGTKRSEFRHPWRMVLRLLGPGLVTGAADDDPSGIATYSQAGPQLGYGFLLTLVPTTPFKIAIQLATIWPKPTINADYFLMVVAVLGTTISPYLFFWQASQEVEEMNQGKARRPLRELTKGGDPEINRIKIDTIVGMIFSNAIAFFIILTTAAVLNANGITNITSAAKAAEALRPLAVDFTFLLFGLGIIGTGLVAIPVLAGSAAYGVSEAFGWHATLEAQAPEAVGFYTIIAAATVIGFGLGFTGIDAIHMLVWSAVLNGIVAVPIMAMMMVIVANSKLMGRFKATSRLIALGWIGTGLMALAVIELFWSFFAG